MTITEYMEQHRGEVVTAKQIAAATGVIVPFASTFMRAVSDRGWADPVPGGWRIP